MAEGWRRIRIVYGCGEERASSEGCWAASFCGSAEAIRKDGFVVKDLNGWSLFVSLDLAASVGSTYGSGLVTAPQLLGKI